MRASTSSPAHRAFNASRGCALILTLLLCACRGDGTADESATVDCFNVVARGSIDFPSMPGHLSIDAEAPDYFGLAPVPIPGHQDLYFLAVPDPVPGRAGAVGYWRRWGDSVLVKWHRNTTTQTMVGAIVNDTLTGVETGRRTELGGTIDGPFEAIREPCLRSMTVPRTQTERWLTRMGRRPGARSG